jgi:hypothetical protein
MKSSEPPWAAMRSCLERKKRKEGRRMKERKKERGRKEREEERPISTVF